MSLIKVRCQSYLKSSRFVPFFTNLTHDGPISDISVLYDSSFYPGMSNLASKLGQIDSKWDKSRSFLRSVSVELSQNVLKLILNVPDLSYLGPLWPNLDAEFDIISDWKQCLIWHEISWLQDLNMEMWIELNVNVRLNILCFFTLWTK